VATDSSANIGIRVFLDDAASRGLYAINSELGNVGTLAKRAGLGFGEMTAGMVGLAALTGLVATMVGFGGAVVLATKDAIEFNTLLIRIQRATNGTDAEMKGMQKTLMDIGGKSIFSLEELADGFVLLGQRGVSAADIIKTVGQAGVYLAESIGSTPVQAMGLLGSTMAAFNLPASEAAKVADLLQYAFEHGVPNVTQLGTAMAKLGSIASLLRIPLDQIIPALDVTSRAMGSGSTAATGLYYFLNQISNGTPKFKAEIEKLGISFYDANGNFIGLNQSLQVLYTTLKDKSPKEAADIMGQLFAVRSGVSIQILLQDLAKLKGLTKELAASHDNLNAAMDRARQAEDSAAGAWHGFMSNVQDALTLMGGPFLAVIQPMILNLRGMAASIRDFAAVNPQVMATFASLAAAISLAGLLILATLSPIGIFVLVMTGVMIAVAGVTAGILYLKTNWQSIVPVLQQVWGVTQQVLAVLLTVGGAIVGIKVAMLTAQFAALIPGIITVIQLLFSMAGALIVNAAQMVAYGIRVALVTIEMTAAMLPAILATTVAWIANAIASMIAMAPYILIAAVIAGMIIGLVLLVQHLGGLNAILAIGKAAWNAIWPSIQQAGDAIKGAFLESVKQLQPVWNQLVAAFNQAKPALMALGAVLGGILAVAIGILIGLIRGAVNVIASIIVTVMHVVSGIIQIFAGLIQFFLGFFAAIRGLFVGIATGNWKQFQDGIHQMASGVMNIFKGLWTAVSSMFIGAFNSIKGFVSGFIAGIIGFFTGLWDKLTRHSIIPDMLGQMLSMFLGIGPKVWNAFGNMVSNLVHKAGEIGPAILKALGNLGGLLVDAGKNIVQGLINGLMGMLGNLKNAAGNLLDAIRNFFPHSPVKEGPLMDLPQWMPNMVNVLAETAERSAPSLRASMSRVAGQVQSGFFSPTGGSGGAAGGEVYNLNIDGKTFLSFFHDRVSGDLSANGLGRLLR